MGIYIIGEGEELFVIAIVVLDGYLDIHPSPLAFDKDRLGMKGSLGSIQIFNKRDDAPFVKE